MKKDIVDVLIVDDRIDGLIALEAVLAPLQNVNLVKAQSGEEALTLLRQYEFGVILLDVQMPDMDGFETAQKIREFENYRLTPIIFVTAINKDDEYIYKGYAAGAVDYIFKPFEPHILRSKVHIFLDLFLKSRKLQVQAELIRESERRERYLKLAELEVESLKRYRNLANAIPHIVWRAKVDGTLDYFNKVWTDFTGLSLEQSQGSGWQQALLAEDLSIFLKSWIHAMSEKKSFEVECRILSKEGDYHWHWIRAVPELRHDEVVAWLGTCTDINERKRSEAELVEAQEVAISANRAKTHFLANMSHEIRTPLAAILGFAELMQDADQAPEQRQHCISTIRRSGQQLLHIIDEILDISKVEAGHLEIEKIDVDIDGLLSELHTMLSVQAYSKGLDLQFNLDTVIPQRMSIDPTRFRQILVNVIGNAIKFTEKGRVSVGVHWKDDHLQVEVSDTGVGINSNQMDRLFQPFMQVDSSTTRRFGGTGLGLALSRKLAQAMGGNVSLKVSDSSIGSTFTIDVAAPVVPGTGWIEKLKISLPEKPVGAMESNLLQGIDILLVDDSPDNQTVIGLFLESAGAKVDFTDNGKEGVQRAMSGHYDIVLMDIQMPYMDGYEATLKLRNQGYKQPIIALTAHALKEERDRCLKVGCTDHMTKPVDRRKLVTQVAAIVRESHAAYQH